MKKVMFALAIAGMFSFAACNNNTEAEAVEDTMIETVEAIAEDAEDAMAAVEGMAEEAVEAVENAEAVAEN